MPDTKLRSSDTIIAETVELGRQIDAIRARRRELAAELEGALVDEGKSLPKPDPELLRRRAERARN